MVHYHAVVDAISANSKQPTNMTTTTVTFIDTTKETFHDASVTFHMYGFVEFEYSMRNAGKVCKQLNLNQIHSIETY